MKYIRSSHLALAAIVAGILISEPASADMMAPRPPSVPVPSVPSVRPPSINVPSVNPNINTNIRDSNRGGGGGGGGSVKKAKPKQVLTQEQWDINKRKGLNDSRNQKYDKGHRPNPVARNELPRQPFPGEAGFTGVPPRGETRFISNEMVLHVGANVSRETVDAAAQQLGLTPLGSQSLRVTGGTLFRFRRSEGRQVADVVRAIETQNIGTAQPNYIYNLQQDARSTAPLPPGDPGQYAVSKLRLGEAHRLAIGKDVFVAVIDSQIDTAHPDLAGAIADQFDAAANPDKPDNHGTGMTGAIVAHQKLLGVAPGARILAVHAFSPEKQSSAQATTYHILAGMDWAIEKGGRVINMSFAGPYDPLLRLVLKKAHDRGLVLIAAAGNLGPRSKPLYPAANENVIAVTAIDVNDKLMQQANQGPYIALAAPGVDILEPAANAEYQVITGTSVAAAHVSGVAALIIERKPDIDSAALEKLLFSTAKDLGRKGRDSQFGFGIVDPYRALMALDPKVAADHTFPQAPSSVTTKPLAAAMTAEKFIVNQPAPGPAPTAAARSTDFESDDARADYDVALREGDADIAASTPLRGNVAAGFVGAGVVAPNAVASAPATTSEPALATATARLPVQKLQSAPIPPLALPQASVKETFEKHHLLGIFAHDCGKPASAQNNYYVHRLIDADHLQRDVMEGPTTRTFVAIIDRAAESMPNEITVSGTLNGRPFSSVYRVEPTGMRVLESTLDGKVEIAGGRFVSGEEMPSTDRCGAPG